MRLAGIPISDDDIVMLIHLLHRVGRADDLALAARLDRAIEPETKILALSHAERDTLLGVLDDPPDGLAELRGVLARDHRDRQTN
jgi:hypothetical protein